MQLVPALVAQFDARAIGDQEVAGSTLAGSATSFRGDWSWFFSTVILSFRFFKKGICQFLAKECAQYWLSA